MRKREREKIDLCFIQRPANKINFAKVTFLMLMQRTLFTVNVNALGKVSLKGTITSQAIINYITEN